MAEHSQNEDSIQRLDEIIAELVRTSNTPEIPFRRDLLGARDDTDKRTMSIRMCDLSRRDLLPPSRRKPLPGRDDKDDRTTSD